MRVNSVIETPEYWIETLQLRRHPEGGYYREVYRSNETIPSTSLPHRFGGARSLSTSIYFLLPGTEVSRFHRLSSDEVWHFYRGSPITLHVISRTGDHQTVRLGRDVDGGDVFQAVIAHGLCFGARLDDKSSFALVGCTLAPGFDYEDFQFCSRNELLEKFPQHRRIIEMLTSPGQS